MDTYNPVLGIKWPVPGTFGIAAVLIIIFLVIIIYFLYKYFEHKEQSRIHNYQHFLFQAKMKGLNSFQFKILKNMSIYLKLSNSKELVSNPALFEATLTDFIEYLKKETEGEDNIGEIFRDLTIIYERLYIPESGRKPLTSMSEIGEGEILFFSTADGEFYLGKVSGKGRDFVIVKLFTSDKNLGNFKKESPLALHILRVRDAEYLVKTSSMGIDENKLRIRISEDFSRGREFRHPFVDLNIPAVVTILPVTEASEPELINCTIIKVNEHECIIRISSSLEYDKVYPISFEISKFSYNVNSRVMSEKYAGTGNIYFVTLKFIDMSDPGMTILSRYISGSL